MKTLGLSLLLVANAPAAIQMITQTATINNGPTPDASFPLTTTIIVDQFDPSLGTLLSVFLSLDTTAAANVRADNESANESDYIANLNGSSVGSLGTLSTTATIAETTDAISVIADNDAAADFIGEDSADFMVVSGAASDSDSTLAPGDLISFTGIGTVSGTVVDSQGWSVSSGGNALTEVSNSQSSTTWTVVYTYDDGVPEPSSALLGGISALLLLRRRR